MVEQKVEMLETKVEPVQEKVEMKEQMLEPAPKMEVEDVKLLEVNRQAMSEATAEI